MKLKVSATKHDASVLQMSILAACILSAFTPFYAYGIVCALLLTAWRFPLLTGGYFASYWTRFIALFLLFAAWIMTLGMYGWLLRTPIGAPLYILGFFAIYTFAYMFIRPPASNIGKQGSTGALLSLALSLVGIVIMISSFYAPKPQLSSTVQIITNGYDNTAHLSLIRTTYGAGGYVYGSNSEIGSQIAWKTLVAYPQGWHWVNAFYWKGLGFNAFEPSFQDRTITMYVVTVATWYFVAIFMFHQLLLYTLRRLKKRVSVRSAPVFTAIVASSLIIQLLVFWGGLTYGFSTYLLAIAYFMLLIGALMTLRTETGNIAKRLPLYIIILALSVAAIAQGWLFAAPVAALSALLGISIHNARVFIKVENRRTIFISILSLIAITIPIAIQVFINLKFSTQGTSQINDDGGIFAINTTLAFLAIAGSLVLLMRNTVFRPDTRTVLLAAVLPIVLFTGILLMYQLLTIGHTAYFFTKSLGLVLCVTWPLLTAGLISLIPVASNGISPLIQSAIICALALTTPFMLGQDMSSFKKLLQRNSNLTTSTAQAVSSKLVAGTVASQHTIVLTGDTYDGDVIGSIFTLTLGPKRDQCVNDLLWVVITRRPSEFSTYAQNCEGNGEIILLTSSKTEPRYLTDLPSWIKVVKN